MRKALLLLLLFFCILPEGYGCTSVVVSGKITPDGRPLLWKNRDTDILQNSVKFFKGERYSFIGIVNSTSRHPKEVWMGTNSAGFSIMNTQSYNLEKVTDEDDPGPSNGKVVARALAICATVQDFRHYLDTIAKPSGIEANIGVIDAKGGAAMFEIGYTKYTYYDANDPKDAPYGYIARTNFSFSGEENTGGGYVRFATEEAALRTEAAKNGITPQWIFRSLSRSFVNAQLGIDLCGKQYPSPVTNGWFVDQDFIPRSITACSVVVQGVKKGENPDLTVMWTALGYPPVSVAFPFLVKYAATSLPVLFTSSPAEKVTPFGQKVDALKKRVFSFDRGTGSGKYLHWEALYNTKGNGIMQQLAPVEDEIFRRSAQPIDRWREKGKVSESELKALYDDLSSYVTERYRTLFGV